MAKAIYGNITLELTLDEARTLLYLCDNIGGSPSSSCRKFVDSIGSALENIGVIAPNDTPLHDGNFTFAIDSLRNLNPPRGE